jgi:hypothetical protein
MLIIYVNQRPASPFEIYREVNIPRSSFVEIYFLKRCWIVVQYSILELSNKYVSILKFYSYLI